MKIVVGVTGASGSIYAKVLLDKLSAIKNQLEAVGLLISDNAKTVWQHELGNDDYNKYSFKQYTKQDFMSPFASGSGKYDVMIICPCSMGTMGRIAAGVSDDLMTRSADVMMKERRKLIMVIRDTPYNLIHINNMRTLTEAGAIICPATPSFYSKPQNFEQLAATVVDRVLDLAGLSSDKVYRWGEEE
jgi:flavin prenyltransferase